jgi:hypothetical protein
MMVRSSSFMLFMGAAAVGAQVSYHCLLFQVFRRANESSVWLVVLYLFADFTKNLDRHTLRASDFQCRYNNTFMMSLARHIASSCVAKIHVQEGLCT